MSRSTIISGARSSTPVSSTSTRTSGPSRSAEGGAQVGRGDAVGGVDRGTPSTTTPGSAARQRLEAVAEHLAAVLGLPVPADDLDGHGRGPGEHLHLVAHRDAEALEEPVAGDALPCRSHRAAVGDLVGRRLGVAPDGDRQEGAFVERAAPGHLAEPACRRPAWWPTSPRPRPSGGRPGRRRRPTGEPALAGSAATAPTAPMKPTDTSVPTTATAMASAASAPRVGWLATSRTPSIDRRLGRAPVRRVSQLDPVAGHVAQHVGDRAARGRHRRDHGGHEQEDRDGGQAHDQADRRPARVLRAERPAEAELERGGEEPGEEPAEHRGHARRRRGSRRAARS